MQKNDFFEQFDENEFLSTFYSVDAETLPDTPSNNAALRRKQLRDETFKTVKVTLDANFDAYLTVGLIERGFSLFAIHDVKDYVWAADLKDALSDAMFDNKFIAATVFQAVTRYRKLVAEQNLVYEFDPVKFRRSLTDKVRSHESFPDCIAYYEEDIDFFKRAYCEALVEQLDLSRDVEDDFFINWEAPFYFDDGRFIVGLEFYNHLGKPRKGFSYDKRNKLIEMCDKYKVSNTFSQHKAPTY